MGQCLGGGLLSLSLSLSLLALVARLWAKFKGLFTHFVVNFSYFIVVFSRLFTCKRHFLGHYAFLKFLNALFLGFLRLSLRAVCLKTADFVILSVAKNPKNLRYALFMDTSLALSMTNLGKSLNLIVFHTQILRTKFTDFTRFFWIATLALLARNDGQRKRTLLFCKDDKAKIQIFYSKFKAFHKFNSFCKFKAFYKFNSFHKFYSKFNSFHNFISNFKPYTRLFHIFTPSFCSVQTDKKFFTRRTLCLNRNF